MISSTSNPTTEAFLCRVECGHERKFVATASCASRLLDRLARRTKHETPDPTRPVTYNRTTYLDTAEQTFLRSPETGLARKLRIREYASAPVEGVTPTLSPGCFLELKESREGMRAKTRLRTDPLSLARILAGEVIGRTLVDPFGAFDTLLEVVQRYRPAPAVTSWYRRMTVVDEERGLRVTVDSGICFTQPVAPGTVPASAFPDRAFGQIPFSVVEVKSPQEMPRWLSEELASLTEVRGFSKFEQGMAHFRREAS